MHGTASVASRSLGKAALLAVCAVAFVLLAWDAFVAPRFDGAIGYGTASDERSVFAVTYVKPGWPADRAGLRVGDRIHLRVGSFDANVANGRFIAGRPNSLLVDRRGKSFILTVTPIAAPITRTFWLTAALDLWLIAFATVIALRGRDVQARVLSWIVLLLALGDLSASGTAQGFMSGWPWLNEFVYLVVYPLTLLFQTALVAFLSASFARPPSVPRRILVIFTYAAALYVALLTAIAQGASIVPWFDPWTWLYTSPAYDLSAAVATVLAAACAGTAIFAARRNERQRATWVLAPLAVVNIVVGLEWILGQLAGGFWDGWVQPLSQITTLLTFLLPLALTYAVLNRRLLDVTFVVNRAAVFSVVSAVVIGAFVLTEWLFNQVFAQTSRTTNTVVGAGVALVLGVSLTYIHRYVDRFVDRVFFWKRHEHEKALRTFGQEAAFITDYDTLLTATLNEVSAHAETDRVSILTLDGDGTYATARCTSGDFERVSENDRAVLRMRASRKAVDLDDLETTLAGSRAYPLTSRGELLGILVCGTKRSGESYAPDEHEALAILAQGVSIAYASLRPDREDLRKVVYEMRDMLNSLVRSPALRMSDNAEAARPGV